MTNWILKINSLTPWKKYGIYTLLALLLFGIGGGMAWMLSRLNPSGENPFTLVNTKTSKEKSEPTIPNPINGVLVTEEVASSWQKRIPLAVAVENIVESRPQSGLSRADLVYESLAEGGVTRFLAIYLSEETEVGPVRSARTYHLDWLSEYQAGFSHWGGSPEAMDLIHEENIKDLDQFSLDYPTYYRVAERPAPHNGYTKTQNLWQAAKERGWDSLPKIDSWKFKDEGKEAGTDARNIKIKFGVEEEYFVDWKFDSEKRLYLRIVGGRDQVDKLTEKQLTAKNIIVQFVKTDSKDGEGRLGMDTDGMGEAKIFRDGHVTQGSWRKSARNSRTRFYDQGGVEVDLNRGQIWVEVIPSSEGTVKGGGIEYSS